MKTSLIVDSRVIDLLLASAKITCEYQDDDPRCVRLCSELFKYIHEYEEIVGKCCYYTDYVLQLTKPIDK